MAGKRGIKARPVDTHKPLNGNAVSTTLERKGKTCICCNPADAVHPLSEYLTSTSPLHADGLVPMCKKCVVSKSFDYVDGRLDINGFMDVLRQIDKPYLPDVLQSAGKSFDEAYDLGSVSEKVRLENRDKLVLFYFRNLSASPTYRRYRWIDGEPPESSGKTESTDKRKPGRPKGTSEEMKAFWGPGFTNEDYLYLQNEFDAWAQDQGGVPESKSQIEVLKNLCYSRLHSIHGVVSGDAGVSSILKSFNDSLSLGNLKPPEKKDADSKPLGVIISEILNYAPADFFADKSIHKDVDNIEEYMKVTIGRSVSNTMLNEHIEDPEYSVTDMVMDDDSTE